MLDINGQAICEGHPALLLCEVLEVTPTYVRVRVMNSELAIDIGVKNDEVLGGLVADSELTAFLEDGATNRPLDSAESDGVAISAFE